MRSAILGNDLKPKYIEKKIAFQRQFALSISFYVTIAILRFEIFYEIIVDVAESPNEV